MAVSARLSELEQAMFDALSLGTSQTDVIREGLRLLWEQRGRAAIIALGVLRPERAKRLRELIESYDGDDPAWFRTVRGTLEQKE